MILIYSRCWDSLTWRNKLYLGRLHTWLTCAERAVREKNLGANNFLHPIRKKVSIQVLSSLGSNWVILRKLSNLSNPPFPHCRLNEIIEAMHLPTKYDVHAMHLRSISAQSSFCIQHNHTKMTDILRFGGYFGDGLTENTDSGRCKNVLYEPHRALQESVTSTLETRCSKKPLWMHLEDARHIKMLLKSKKQNLKTAISNMNLY